MVKGELPMASITLEERIAASQERVDRSFERVNQAIERLVAAGAETDLWFKQMAAASAETDLRFKQMAAAGAEMDSRIEKMISERITAGIKLDLQFEKMVSDADQRKKVLDLAMIDLKESQKRTNESLKRTEELIGNLGGKLGVIIELLLIPGICQLMNEYGHDFVRVCPNVKIRKNKIHTQIDLMLYDTTEAMAVEIKTQLDAEDVRWHLNERLSKMRELENEFGIKDKKLYGAVAGIFIDDRARQLALNNGLYVIEIRENEKIPLKAEAPAGKPKEW
jgi:hypothetical protein